MQMVGKASLGGNEAHIVVPASGQSYLPAHSHPTAVPCANHTRRPGGAGRLWTQKRGVSGCHEDQSALAAEAHCRPVTGKIRCQSAGD